MCGSDKRTGTLHSTVRPQLRGAQPGSPATLRLLGHLLDPNRLLFPPGWRQRWRLPGAALEQRQLVRWQLPRRRISPASTALAGPRSSRWLQTRRHGKGERMRRFFSKPRSRAPFVNLAMFPNSGCGEIHTGSGLLQSLTGNQDLCPILVCLILRLPGSNHSSLLHVHGLHLDSVKYPWQAEKKTNPTKRLASTNCPAGAVCGCVPPVPAQRRSPLRARAWPPAPGEGSRR